MNNDSFSCLMGLCDGTHCVYCTRNPHRLSFVINFSTKALIIVLKPVTIGWSNLPQEIVEYTLRNDNLEQRQSFNVTNKGTLKALSWSVSALPVLTPPVKIHAPVVTAALIRPLPNTCLSLGWRSKFWRPPWTEMSNVGSSSCQSFTIRCSRLSGLVS